MDSNSQPSLPHWFFASGFKVADPADVFSYSPEMDKQFLDLTVKFSQVYPVEYFSPFPELYFSAYLDWAPQLDGPSYFQPYDMVTPLASQNIQTVTVTPTGLAYAELAHSFSA